MKGAGRLRSVDHGSRRVEVRCEVREAERGADSRLDVVIVHWSVSV
jgi:hypothetical protein